MTIANGLNLNASNPLPMSSGGTGVATTATGTGNLVFSTSPTLVTPALGTPSALVLTNATGLPAPAGLNASGSPSAATYLRGDNTWAVPMGGSGGIPVAYTPTLNFSGLSVGITYNTQVGWYIQIGQLVFFTANIALSNAGSSSGNAAITLPTATGTLAGLIEHIVYPFYGNITYPAGSIPIGLIPTGGSNSLSLYYQTTGADFTAVDKSMFNNASACYVSGCYMST